MQDVFLGSWCLLLWLLKSLWQICGSGTRALRKCRLLGIMSPTKAIDNGLKALVVLMLKCRMA